ncbi:MAG: cupin-like domain-containing protein [Armatimonadetes bacterium]|nr:cupin-like domain-containing protein [Armatimonadota bacterium]
MIDRRANLSVEAFLEEYAYPCKPVILQGLTDHWTARKWTVDMFAERYYHVEVEVSRNDSPYLGWTQMKLGDYIRDIRKPQVGRPYYLSSWYFRIDCPELLNDFSVPPHFSDDWFGLLDAQYQPPLMWLFIGPPGAGSWLHIDIGLTSAWNVQITGRKRWILFPPDQSRLLYGGQVDGFNPDLEKFPDFARTSPIDCVVEPGEVIFTPTLWWHQTSSLEEGIALTANYANDTNHPHVLNWLKANRRWVRERGNPRLVEMFEAIARERAVRGMEPVRMS